MRVVGTGFARSRQQFARSEHRLARIYLCVVNAHFFRALTQVYWWLGFLELNVKCLINLREDVSEDISEDIFEDISEDDDNFENISDDVFEDKSDHCLVSVI